MKKVTNQSGSVSGTKTEGTMFFQKSIKGFAVAVMLLAGLVFNPFQSFAQLPEGFEGATFPPIGWSLTNNFGFPWSLATDASAYGAGSNSAMMDFYDLQNGGWESLTTPVFAPSQAGYGLQFDEAYASFGNSQDYIQINYSQDGGNTWNYLVQLNGGDTGPLNTGGDVSNERFVPTNNQWQTFFYSLPTGTNMLQFIGYSYYGNNLYIDNININPSCLLTNPTITGGTNFCGSGILDAGAGFASYQWDDSNNTTTEQLTVTSTGTYCVTVTNASGCTGASCIDVTVSPNPPPTPVLISAYDTIFCQSTDAYLYFNTGYDSYLWSDGTVSNYINDYVTTDSTFSVTVTDGDGCTGVASINFTLLPPIVSPVITASQTAFCYGDSAILDAGPGYNSYAWNTGPTDETITAFNGGYYDVTVTNNDGCGVGYIYLASIEGAYIYHNNSVDLCNGPLTDLSAFFSDGYEEMTYLWSTGANTQTITITSPGTYSVTETGNYSGCTLTATTTIASIGFTMLTNGPTTFCEGGYVFANVGYNYESYIWSDGGTNYYEYQYSTGTYCVTATDFNGCTASACIDVIVNPVPSPVITGPIAVCNGNAVLDAGGPYATYLWNPTGETTEDITATTPGWYYVTVTNDFGCAGNAYDYLYGPSTVSILQGNQSELCNGPGVDLTPDYNGFGPFSYLWNTGDNTETITVNSPGSYSVTMTDGNSCTATATISIATISGITINTTSPSPYCQGSAYMYVNGNFASYLWSDNSNGFFDAPSTSGNYCVTVTDNNSCTASTCIDVVINSSPTPVITGPTGLCNAGTLTLDAGGSYATYNWYLYDYNTNNWDNIATTEVITISDAGDYYVAVTDFNGCNGSVGTYIYTQPTISISQNATSDLCNPSSVLQADVSPYGGSSFLWNDGSTNQTDTILNTGTYNITATGYYSGCTATGSINVTSIGLPVYSSNGSTTMCTGDYLYLNGNFTTYLWNDNSTTWYDFVTSTGTYCVTATDISGCTATACIDIIVNTGPTPVITGPASTLCRGDAGVLDAGGPYVSYDWIYTGQTTEAITVINGGYYQVNVTDANGCNAYAGIYLNVNQSPIPIITPSGAPEICGNNTVTLDAGTYNNNDSWSTYLWSTGDMTETTTASTPGTYCVTVTDNNGCTGTACIEITSGSSPNPVITPDGPTTFCFGGSVNLDAGNYTSYYWITGDITETINATISGDYFVTVTDANGCTGVTDILVTVNNTLNPVITASGPTSFCQSGSVTLDAGLFENYNWSTGDTNETITESTSDNYTVTVSDINGCIGIASQYVSANANPTPSITPNGPTTLCSSSSLNLDAGFYNYNSSTYYMSYIWSTGSVIRNIIPTSSGTYCVTVTDYNGCTGIDCIDVTINESPTPVITPNGPTAFCQGGSVMLSTGNYSSYLWNTTEVTQSITVSTSNNYIVTVTASDGCTGIASQIVTVHNNPIPSITPNGPTTFCNGSSVILNAGNYSSYLWSNAAITQSITVSTSNTFKVTVTDNNGCTGISSPITVTVNAAPTPVITANGPTNFCQGGSVILSTGNYSSYDWSSGGTNQSVTASASGGYNVTVTSVNGCTGVTSQIVNAYPNPTPVITPDGPTTFCSGNSLLLDAGFYNYNSGSFYSSYTWSTGANTEYLDVTTSNTFTVTITDDNGCSGVSSPLDVIVNPSPTPVITANGPTNFCQGGSVLLSTGNYSSYNWSTTEITQSITVSTSGNYTVTVTAANGCTGIANQVVNAFANPTPSITPIGPTTFCSAGSLSLDAGYFNNNSNTFYSTYIWSTGAVTRFISPTTTETYCVTIADANGCTGGACIDVTVNPSPTPVITPSGPTTFCQGGSVTLSTGNYSSYLWNTTENTQSITASTSNGYAVTVTAVNGCTGIASQIVTVNANPTPSITPNGPTTFCSGGSLNLDAGYYNFNSNSFYSSYSWSTGAITRFISPTTTGSYCVTVTDDNGCTGEACISVSVNPSPTPIITPSGSTTFCQGGSVGLSTGNYSSYNWSTTDNTQSITVSASNNYIVTVTASNGCTGTASQVVIANANPTPSITPSGPTTFCSGGSVNLNAGNYNYNSNTNYSTYLWSTGSVNQTIAVTTSGTYCVTVTDDNGCTGLDCIVVTVNVSPAPTITPNGPISFCEGGSVLLTTGNFASYIWNTGANTQSITVSTSNIYSVTVTSVNSCTAIASQVVTVNPNPTPVITPSGPIPSCQASNLILSTGSYNSYLWSTGATTQTIGSLSSSTYTVTVSNFFSCTGTASQAVTINPNPTPVITPNGSTVLCAGGEVTLSSNSYTSYNWNTGANTQSITVISTSGNYVVTVTDANGCTASASQNVSIVPSPTPVITANGPVTFCEGGALILNAGNYTLYNWNNGDNTQTITVLTGGIYSVTVTDAYGCTGIASKIVTVNTNPNPTIIPNGSTTFCEGGSVSLDAGLYTTYNWSNGNNTEIITVAQSANYSVTVTDNDGCTGIASQVVTVNTFLNPSITPSGPTTFCLGDFVNLDAGSYEFYNWSTGDNTETIHVTTAGTYSVTVTSNDGCTGIASIVVSVGNSLSIAITPNGPVTFCQGGSVILNAGSFSSYLWSNSSISSSILVSTSGTYTVTVTDVSGCTGSASEVVTVNPVPTTPIITTNGSTTFCLGGSVTLDAGNLYSTYSWNTGASTETISVTTGGNYAVTVTNIIGCTAASAAENIIVNSVQATIDANGPISFCIGSNVTLNALPNGASDTYLWSNGSNTGSITVNNSGTFTVTITDNTTNCTGVASVITTSNPYPIAVASNSGPYCSSYTLELFGSNSISLNNNFYHWSGPDGFTSTDQNPTILNIQNINTGTYTVTVTGAGNCTSITTTNVSITGIPPYFTYSGDPGFTTSLVNPGTGSTTDNYHFEVMYYDAGNNMPASGFPLLELSYLGNGVYTGPNDRTYQMNQVTPGNNAVNGILYSFTPPAGSLAAGTTYTTRVIAEDNTSMNCLGTFGPFSDPNVLNATNISIFANDITFSSANPAVSSAITVYATIHNESDYDAINFYVNLQNQFTLQSFPYGVPVSVAAHSTLLIQWNNIPTPSVPSWNPMEVTINSTGSLTETNYLDDQAIRPFVCGNFILPGDIEISAQVSPQTSLATANNYLYVSGQAHYRNTAIQLQDSTCAGATVTLTVPSTGATYTGYTNNQGIYNLGFWAPVTPGNYLVNVAITDYTLNGDTTAPFYLEGVNNCVLPDLVASLVSLSSYCIVVGDSITGNYSISDYGCANVTIPTENTWSCSGSTPSSGTSFTTAPLLAGNSQTFSLPSLTFNTPGTYYVSDVADASFLVVESNYNNNVNTSFPIRVLPACPDIVPNCPASQPLSYYYCHQANIPFCLSNIGGYDTQDSIWVSLHIIFDNNIEEIYSKRIGNIPSACANNEVCFNFTHTFANVGAYILVLYADTANEVSECNESNNVLTVNANVISCGPDLYVAGCGSFDVSPVDPYNSSTMNLSAVIGNGGTSATTVPSFIVHFALSNNTSYDYTYNGFMGIGASSTITINNVPRPTAPGVTLTVTVDPNDVTGDYNLSNNTNSTPLDYDFAAGGYCGQNWNVVCNQPFYPSAGLFNYGSYIASHVHTLFEIMGPGYPTWDTLGYATNDNVGITCSCPYLVQLSTPFSCPYAGTYQMRITANYDNAYLETTLANNQVVISFQSVCLPDYRVLSQYIEPSLLNPAPNQPITVNVSYYNIGGSYYSPDSLELTLKADNTIIDSVKGPAELANGNHASVHFDTTWSSPIVGIHVFRATVNSDYTINEGDTSNNQATRAVIVGTSPDLYFTSLYPLIAFPSINDNDTIYATVHNGGDIDAVANVLFKYVDQNGDTVQFYSVNNVHFPQNGDVNFAFNWMVLNPTTTIYSYIVNTVPGESRYDNNEDSTKLNGLNITIDVTQSSCPNYPDGSLSAHVTGGVPPYIYGWSTGSNNPTIFAEAGTYTLIVHDNIGNSIFGTGVITSISNPNPVITYDGTPSFCYGATDILDAGIWASYYWSTGDNTETISVTTSGTYTVTITNDTGCIASASIAVNIHPMVSPAIAPIGSTSFCDGNSVSLSAGNFDSYLWNTGATTPDISINSSGTYSVTVTDLGNCTGTASSVINVTVYTNPNPSISPNGPTTFDQGGNVILDAGSYSFYLWSSGAVTETIDVTVGSTYTVTVTDINGCTGTASIVITVNNTSVLTPVITANGATIFCDGNSVTLDAGGPYASYLWGNGAITETITVINSGTYTVTVTDNFSNTGSTSQVVLVNPNPTPTISGASSTCQGNSVTLDAGSYSGYSWSDGDATETTSVSTSGNVCVTVTDINGCQGSACQLVTINPNPTPSISGATSDCAGNSVTLDAGSYSGYTWSDGDVTEITSVSSTGNICVTVTDINGCQGSACQLVTINPNPTPTISGASSVCQGNSVTLDAGSYSGYSWSDGDITETTSVSASGNVCVTVTDINGCQGSACQLVTINPNPTPSISGSSSACQGNSVTLDAGSYSGYSWSDGDVTETTPVSSTGNVCVTVTDINGCQGSACQLVTINPNPTPSISGASSACQGNSVTLDAGSYSGYSWSDGDVTETSSVSNSGNFCVTVTDINGCQGSACQLVTINPNPTPSISGASSACQGNSVTLDAGSYSGYSWSDGDVTETTSVSSTGNVCVTVTDINGCQGSACQLITINPNPTPTISGSSSTCQGNSVILDAGSYSGYSWSDGDVTETTPVSSTGNVCVTVTDINGCQGSACQLVTINPNPTPSISGASSACQGNSVTLDAGSYSGYSWSDGDVTETSSVSNSGNFCVTVTDINGCQGSACQLVTINPNPTPSISGASSACQGNSVTLDAGSYSGYSWSDGDATETTSVSTSGNVCVTVTDINGCQGSACQLVTINPNPTPSISGSSSACQGISVTLDAGSYSGYSWSDGDVTETTSVSSTGNVCVTVTDINGCQGSACQLVTINPNPTPSISGSSSACQGNSVTLDAGSYSGYSWSDGDATETTSVSTSGNVCVTVTDINGCQGSACQLVTINPNPTPSISGASSACQGNSVTLDAGSYSGYLWSDGDATETTSVSSTGNVCVTVTDISGCQGSACQLVTINPNPSPVISGPASICGNTSATLSAGVYNSYLWSTGATTPTISASTTGNYCVTVTNAMGCTGNACHSLTVLTSIQVTITPNGPTSFCQGGSVTLDAGAGYSSYIWSNGAGTESTTVNSTGVYKVTVTNASGCSGTASQTVTVTAAITGLTITGPTTACAGGSVTLSTGTTYGSYLWSTGAVTQSISVSTTGQYSVTVSNGNGCTASNHQSVTFTSVPVPVISPSGPVTFCSGGSVNLNVTGTYTSYLWSTGAVSQGIGPVNTSGNYCVTVTNASGCTGSTCITITVTNNVVPIITPGTIPSACTATSMILGANQGFATYLWSTGAQTQYINILAPGTYTVSVTTATGCSGSASYTTTTFCPKVAAAMTASPAFTNCLTTTLDAGAGYASYHWSNATLTETNVVTASGTYTVTVTSSCGCSATVSHSVTIGAAVTPSITATGLASYCEGSGNAVLQASANTSYLWSTGAVTQTITLAPGNPGTYTVTVTNSGGCTGSASQVVSTGCSLCTFPATPTTNIVATGGMANWFEPSCYYGFTVRISVHNANVWTSYTITPNTHYMFSGLTHNTMYDWQIQTNCNASGTLNSGFSATQTFMTSARLDDGESTNTESTFNVYPNPTDDHVTITFMAGNEDVYSIRLIDMTGRIVQSANMTSAIGDNQYLMDLSQVAKGIYMVILQNKDAVLQSKIVVQ